MPKIARNITDLIGKTPLLRLHNYEKANRLNAALVAKLEFFNPAGSVKDRVALAILNDAEERGILEPGGTVIEATSGNTGVGLAAAAASRGYRVIITMPDTMSVERRRLLEAYGAELVLTGGALGMKGAIAKAEELAANTPGAFIPRQFSNPANPRAHYDTTGPEIWEDTGGKTDILVCGVGTGGTVSGAGGFLKSKNPGIQIIAVEPADSPVLSEGRAGAHGIQGIGAGFVPEILNTEIYDEAVAVTYENALETARDLARLEGVLTGISSGAALWAAARIAERPENAKKMIVVVLPDTGERYLSIV